MSNSDIKRYNTYLIIIIASIFFIEIVSKMFYINNDLKALITNFLFAIGSLLLLFGWQFKLFIFLNVLGFLKFNISLIANNLILPEWMTGDLYFNLQMIKYTLTVIIFLIIIAGFQNQLRLGSWKDIIKINKWKITTYYILGTIFIQFIIRLI